MVIWCVLWLFGLLCGLLVHFPPILVCCTKKTLATLLFSRANEKNCVSGSENAAADFPTLKSWKTDLANNGWTSELQLFYFSFLLFLRNSLSFVSPFITRRS
jgi:hypothetical protein